MKKKTRWIVVNTRPTPKNTPVLMSTSRKRENTIPTPRIWPATYVNEMKLAHSTATTRAVCE